MSVERSVVERQLEKLGAHAGVFTRKELRHLPAVLAAGETIHGVSSGFYESKSWIVVVTDLRILFLDCGMFFGIHQVDLPLSQISAVSQKASLLFGEIEVTTSGGKRSISRVPRDELAQLASTIVALVHGELAGSAPKADETARASELGTQLEKIVTLWRQGALTDEEFERAKARLIGA